jgi:hypothetical protein
MKKLTNVQIRAKKCQIIPTHAVHVKNDQPKNPQQQVLTTTTIITTTTITTVVENTKTAFGREVKPVLVPIKTENVPCNQCDSTFSSLISLKNHIKRIHRDGDKMCQKVAENATMCYTHMHHHDFVPSPIEVKKYLFKCDICHRKFDKRSRMIRHITSVHSSDIHKVDLSRFVYPPKKVHPWNLIEL